MVSKLPWEIYKVSIYSVALKKSPHGEREVVPSKNMQN
jgi:hypothetical protein